MLGGRASVADYQFVTQWDLDAPVERVWPEIHRSDLWPTWWRGVESVDILKPGGDHGVGGVRRYVWRSKLPYRLTFDMEVTRVVPLVSIEGVARGELDGHGTWQFTRVGEGRTHVRYDWVVKTTKAWMNLLSPIARPFFGWNHDVVMEWGRDALVARLGDNGAA
jgi:uncharacterized protein YndB with AHSA1/START domain